MVRDHSRGDTARAARPLDAIELIVCEDTRRGATYRGRSGAEGDRGASPRV